MIEIAPDIFHVPGVNKARFPYCNCMYIKGRDLRVLIDASMGQANLKPVMDSGIDLIILSHAHIDHRFTRRHIPEIPVWCSELEAHHLESTTDYFKVTGLARSGIDIGQFLSSISGVDLKADRTLSGGEVLDFGGVSVEVIHAPGHTPGHLAFFIRELGLLFSGDVDLTSFGPFYGHDYSDIAQTRRSISLLQALKPRLVLTGHAGPFNSRIDQRFEYYQSVILKREQKILAELDRPRTFDHFTGRRLIYPSYPEPKELGLWFEQIHIEKHLDDLANRGVVEKRDGVWSLKSGYHPPPLKDRTENG